MNFTHQENESQSLLTFEAAISASQTGDLVTDMNQFSSREIE